MEKFKKDRGHFETVVLTDQSQIVTRWNENAPVTLISSCLGDQPLGTAKRCNKKEKKYMDIPQPFVVNQYNKFMSGTDRFEQNNNHLRISVGGKKRYWPIVTWLGDSGVPNAWQLFKKGGGVLTLLIFKRDLVCNILRGAAATRSRNSTGSTGPIGARPGAGDLRYDCMNHFVKVQIHALWPRPRWGGGCGLEGRVGNLQAW